MSKIITILEGQTGKIVYRPTFRNVPIPNGVTIDKDNSVLKDAINLGECKANEDGITGEVPFTAKAKAKSDLQIVFVRKDANGSMEGKDISTQGLTVDIGPSELSIVSAAPDKVKHSSDNTYQINMSLKNGDQAVSLKDSTLINNSSDTFTIVGTNEDSFNIKMAESKINKDPSVFSTDFNFNLSLYSSSVSHALKVCWEPVIKAEKLVTSMTYGDKGTMPIKITNGKGEDITSSITGLTCVSEYFKFSSNGDWEVIKEVTANTTETVTFNFNVNQEGFEWSVSLEVSFDLLAKPASITATRLSDAGVTALTNGKLKFKLTYDNGDLVTDAVGVKYTNDSSSTSFSSFGSNFKMDNGPNGEYTVDYTSGYVAGNSSGTVTIKTKFGEYVVNLPSISCYSEPVTFTPDTTLLPKGSTNTKIEISAKQRQSMDGSTVPIYGTLVVSWLKGATVKSGPTGNGPWTVYFADDPGGNIATINLSVNGLTGSMTLYKA